jgi:hypothetical protein
VNGALAASAAAADATFSHKEYFSVAPIFSGFIRGQ